MASPEDYQRSFGVGKVGAAVSGFNSFGWGGGAYHAGSLNPNPDQPFQRGWNTADNEITDARENVTAWTRHLWRNDPKMATMYRLRAEAVVGTALRVEATPMFRLLQRDPIWADDWSSGVELWYKAWGADDEFRCDAHQSMNWGSIAKLAYCYWDAEGECLGVMRMLDRGGMFETCVEIIDPERLSNPPGASNFMLLANGNRVVDGVEINALGASVAYHIRVMHEADTTASIDKFRWERIPRFNQYGRPNVVHAVNPRRASQRRGIAAMAAGISTINRYGDYERAVVKAWQAHAMMFPWLESGDTIEEVESALPSGIAEEDKKEFFDIVFENRVKNAPRFEGKKMFVGMPGEKVHAEMGDLGDSPADFLKMGDRQLAGLAGVPHPVAYNAWDDITYSSGQMMLAYSNRGEDQDLTEFASKFARPIYRCVLEEMMMKGRVKPARRFIDFYTMTAAYTACKFHGPGNIIGDPVKEGLGNDYLLNQGLVAWSQLVAKRGGDPEEVRQARLRDMRKDSEMGLPAFVPFKGNAAAAQTDSTEPQQDQGQQEQNQMDNGTNSNGE